MALASSATRQPAPWSACVRLKAPRAKAAPRRGRSPLAVDARGVSLTFQTRDGEVEALSKVDLQIADGRFRLLHRPVGLRQDHAAARHRRSRAADAPARFWSTASRPSRRGCSRHYGYIFQAPALYPVADHRAQRHAAAGDHGIRRRRAARGASSAISSSSISPASSASFPGSCPAACSSAPRSRARCRSSRRCC